MIKRLGEMDWPARVLLLVAFLLVAFLAGVASGVHAQPTIAISTLPDITGDGSLHSLASSGTALWITIDCPKGNSAAIRFGDANAGSTAGTACAPGDALHYPPVAVGPNLYSFATIKYNAANGDVFHIQYAH